MAPHYTVQSIFGTAMGASLAVGSLIMFFARKNENSRKTIYFLLSILGLLVAMEYSSNFTYDSRITVDSRTVEWTQPIHKGIQGVILSVVLGLFFGLELPIIGAAVLLVAGAASFWEFSALGGSTADQKPDAMYLMFAVFAMFWLYVLKVWGIFSHHNVTMWIFLIISLVGAALLTATWFAGSSFLNTLPSLNIESWLGVIATMVLFFLMPIGVIIFHGEKPFVNRLIEMKHKLTSRV